MFESEKTTREGQKKIIWDNRESFLISPLEKGTDCYIEELVEKDSIVLRFCAKKKQQEPFFGQQDYWDCSEGVSFVMNIPEADAYTALHQHKPWWLRPAFLQNAALIPKKTQLLLISSQNRYFVILAVCGEECRSDMQGSDEGLRIKCASNRMNEKIIQDIGIVITGGDNPYQCIHNAAERALAVLGKEKMARSQRKYPELKQKKVPVKWVLIDDGWLLIMKGSCLEILMQTRKSSRMDSGRVYPRLNSSIA